jgi:pimeloyl-ACP methyl ester carboxylesterase
VKKVVAMRPSLEIATDQAIDTLRQVRPYRKAKHGMDGAIEPLLQFEHSIFSRRRRGTRMTTSATDETPPTVTVTGTGPITWRSVGTGPTVVSLHGVLGGHAQGLAALRFLAGSGFRVLAPSRPGYSGTPLSVGASIGQQADALAGLLDALDIDRVTVSGASAGGPTALQFAVRHPDRVVGLVLFSAVTAAPETPPGRLVEAMFANRLTFGLMARLTAIDALERSRTRRFVRSLSTYSRKEIREEVERLLADPTLREQLQSLFPESRAAWREAVAGAGNDIHQTGTMGPLPFGDVRCPTLVVHGTADGSPATFAGAEAAARAIPGATLYPVPGGWHMLAASPQARAMETTIADFVTSSFAGAER